MIVRDALRWNGWGRKGESTGFSRAREAALLSALGGRLGRRLTEAAEPVPMDAVCLEPSKISGETLASLRAGCGEEGVFTSATERITHAAGRSLPDLLRLRRGELSAVPDVVVVPRDEGAVAAVLRVAAEAQLAVVPFGGGSSVVGGVEPRKAEGQSGVLCLDTTRLDRLVRFDEMSRIASFQAGIDGPALEAALSTSGFTLGHFPQSFEHSTLGGWIATRSSGQQSNGYGSIENLLVAVRVVTPSGVIRNIEVPRSAAGPDLRELILGSEGSFGVIVEATLRVRPLPAAQREGGVLFHTFADGVAAIRGLVQSGVPASMLRLSDASETELTELLRKDPARRFDLAGAGLGLLARFGYGTGRCLLLFCTEGEDPARVRRAAASIRSAARSHGGIPLGASPGRHWRRDRFRSPYLRDWLLDHGVAVDTFETSVPWSRVTGAAESVVRALRSTMASHAGSGLAMAHLSHSYADGACLYFTVLYPLATDDDLGQWRAIKRDATDAIRAAGGTVSHHHGVGHDHLEWMGEEKGALGIDALRAFKATVDPQGLMNPGKLL